MRRSRRHTPPCSAFVVDTHTDGLADDTQGLHSGLANGQRAGPVQMQDARAAEPPPHSRSQRPLPTQPSCMRIRSHTALQARGRSRGGQEGRSVGTSGPGEQHSTTQHGKALGTDPSESLISTECSKSESTLTRASRVRGGRPGAWRPACRGGAPSCRSRLRSCSKGEAALESQAAFSAARVVDPWWRARRRSAPAARLPPCLPPPREPSCKTTHRTS